MRLTLPILLLLLVSAVFGHETKCPSIEFNGPPTVVQPDEPMTFTLSITPDSSEYKAVWSVENGNILDGKALRVLRVEALSPNSTVRASVRIEGLPGDCKNRYSDTGVVAVVFHPRPTDVFGSLPDDDIRNRLDLFFSDLQQRPRMTGFIMTAGYNEDVDRLQTLVYQHALFRRFPTNRFRLFRSESTQKLLSELWILPDRDRAAGIMGRGYVETRFSSDGLICPNVTMSGPPAIIGPENEMFFNLKVSHLSSVSRITWTSNGYELKVSDSNLSASLIAKENSETPRVTARVEGPGDCVSIASDTGFPLCSPEPRLLDEFGENTSGYIKSAIDLAVTELESNPRMYLIFVIAGAKKARVQREKFIRTYLELRGIKSKRIAFRESEKTGRIVNTRVWLVGSLDSNAIN